MSAGPLPRRPPVAPDDVSGRVGRLFRQGSIYALGTALQLGAALLILPVLTRSLDTAAYGTVALAVVTLTFATATFGFGIAPVITREWYGGGGPPAARELAIGGLLPAVIATAATCAAGPLWAPLLGGDQTSLVLAALAALPAVSASFSCSLLRAAARPVAFTVVILVSAVGSQIVGLALLLLVVETRDPSAYVAGLAVGNVVAAVLGLLLTGTARVRPAGRAAVRAAMRIGIPSMVAMVTWAVLALGDRAVLAALEDEVAVARYQVAYTIGGLSLTALVSLSNALTPGVLGAPDDSRVELLLASMAQLRRMTLLLAASVAFVGPVAVEVMAPAEYEGSDVVAVTAIVAVSPVLYLEAITAWPVLLWHGRTSSLGWASVLAATASVGLAALALLAWNLVGVALASVAAYTVVSVATYRAARGLEPALPGTHRATRQTWLLGAAIAAAGATLPVGEAGVAVRLALGAAAGVALAAGARAVLTRSPAPRSTPGEAS